jgi:hypothetical protein
MINTSAELIVGDKRLIVVCSKESLPSSAKNCLGKFWRDSGHNLLPLPPAKMAAHTLLMHRSMRAIFNRFFQQPYHSRFRGM